MMKYSVFIVSTLLVSSIAGLSVVSDPKAAQIPVELLFQENFCKDANITAIKQCLGDIKTPANLQMKSNLLKECFGSFNTMDLQAKFCQGGNPRTHLTKATDCMMKMVKTFDQKVVYQFENCLRSVFTPKLVEKKHELAALWSFFSSISSALN